MENAGYSETHAHTCRTISTASQPNFYTNTSSFLRITGNCKSLGLSELSVRWYVLAETLTPVIVFILVDCGLARFLASNDHLRTLSSNGDCVGWILIDLHFSQATCLNQYLKCPSPRGRQLYLRWLVSANDHTHPTITDFSLCTLHSRGTHL